MSILVFGRTGQVAREIRARASVIALGREDVDLSDAGACAAAILEHRPSSVINAAAYTAVDKAEDEEGLAMRINADSPAAMARACAELAIPLVHISTDYVFDGAGVEPFSPEDPTNPVSAYGTSKLRGEEAVVAAGCPHAILRTSWVFSAHGRNFVKTMLDLGSKRDALSIVDDQVGGPTPAGAIAAACLAIAARLANEPKKSGIYHLCGAPDVSWADFAEEIFTAAGIACDITRIPTSEYPTPATRPLNSRLDCSSTLETFGIDRPDWRSDLRAVLKQIKDKKDLD